MNRNRVKISICGVDYAIFADEEEEYVCSVAREVERRMEDLMHGSNRVSLTTAAVMTAMSCCDEELKITGTADSLRTQIREYLTDSTRCRSEAAEAMREIDRLKAQIRDLNNEVTALSEKNAADAKARLIEIENAHRLVDELREENRTLKKQLAGDGSLPPEPDGDIADQTRLELPGSAQAARPGRSKELSNGEFMSLFDTFTGSKS